MLHWLKKLLGFWRQTWRFWVSTWARYFVQLLRSCQYILKKDSQGGGCGDWLVTPHAHPTRLFSPLHQPWITQRSYEGKRVLWGSNVDQERLEPGIGAPEGQGGSRWCRLLSTALLPRGQLQPPSSPLSLVVTIGNISHGFGRNVQVHLLRPINSVAWMF